MAGFGYLPENPSPVEWILMPPQPSHDGSEEAVAREANRLYWETPLGVNRIVEALDLSKGALYELLQPLSADESCGVCGAPRVFTNRTARAQGESQCLKCDEAAEAGGREDVAQIPSSPVYALPEKGINQTVWLAALVGGVAGFFMGRALGGRRRVHVRRSSP